MNTPITIRKRVAAVIVAGVLAVGLPLAVNAQNNQGQNNNDQGQNNNNRGQNDPPSAPLPEPAMWIGMGTLAGAAALLVLAQRRRKTS